MRYFLLLEAAALLTSLDFGNASSCRPASSATISFDGASTSTLSPGVSETLSNKISTIPWVTQTDTVEVTNEASPTDELSTAITELTTTETTSEASLITIEFTTDISTTDALPTTTTVFSETVSSIESTDIASTTTSPTEAPTYTNLVKNGDFRLSPQQGEYLPGFTTSSGRLTTLFGYTRSGSDETNGAMLPTVISTGTSSSGFLKQKIIIPKRGRVAARLMYSLYEAQAASYNCDLTLTIREKRVAQVRLTNDLGTWMTLEGYVDVDAGEGDLVVTLQCIFHVHLSLVVDQIVVSDEASLEDLDRVKFVY